METQKRWHLFQRFGIELEYMIVDRDTLDIKPIADQLLQDADGKPTDEFNNGPVTWSNELVLHVVEFKCTEPTSDLFQLLQDLKANIAYANLLLEKYNARLLGTAAHPWMDPARETKLWPMGNAEIYETYDRIFNCKGHGWANLQSMHINLPFYDDEEFAQLHAAIRVILPLLPALAASSPILDQKPSGVLDTRMIYYQKNQQAIPEITGRVIPENVKSKRLYHKKIYDKIAAAVAPHDPKKILDPIWLNSRGCIARFDRGAIEIRILDIQEAPAMDLAIAVFIIHLLKLLTQQKLSDFHTQGQWAIEPLFEILQSTIEKGPDAQINNKEYLKTLGINDEAAKAKDVIANLVEQVALQYPRQMEPWLPHLRRMIALGPLSSRILKVANNEYGRGNLRLIYGELAENLAENKMFEPWSEPL